MWDKLSEVLFLLSLRLVICFSGDLVVTFALGLDIIEILVLSFLTSIYFGFYIFVLLSDKLAGEIDPDLFIYFTVYSVSALLDALGISNDLDLSNDISLFDSLLMDLYFLLLDACVLSVLFMMSILFFAMG